MTSDVIAMLRGVGKSYNLGTVLVPALTNIDLCIAADRFTVIAGPSGSGKTTLLNLLGCIDHPDNGAVFVNGVEVAGLTDDALSEFRLRHLGFIFQNFNLLPVLTVYENVELPLLWQNVPRLKRRARVNSLLDAVGLAGKANCRPNQLSGGQCQRVAIARALVLQPKMVLADEPTANLDSVTSASIIELMRALQRDQHVSFVFSSHDPMVLAAADDVVHIRDGRLTNTTDYRHLGLCS